MTSLDAFADPLGSGSRATPLLEQLRARRDRVRLLLQHQAELLAQLEGSLKGSPPSAPDNQFAQLQQWLAQWQQRQDENWERQLTRLDVLAEQMVDLTDAVQQGDATASAPKKPPAAAPVPASNWEQAKQRLWAESDNVADEPAAAVENKSPGKSRRLWQQMLAEKDAEITELRQQLQQALSTAAPAMPAFVDQDELIKSERENLRKLQEEWQEKLRRAEIEISLERAKLARERAQFEDKMQSQPRDANPPANPAAADAPRSRWKARLGLLDE